MRLEEYRQQPSAPGQAGARTPIAARRWFLAAAGAVLLGLIMLVAVGLLRTGSSTRSVRALPTGAAPVTTPIVVVVAPPAPSATVQPSPTAIPTVNPTPVGPTTTECTWRALDDGSHQQTCTQFGR